MSALTYLTLTQLKNRVKGVFRSPAKLIYAVIIVALLVLVVFAGNMDAGEGDVGTPNAQLGAIIIGYFALMFLMTANSGFSTGMSIFKMPDVNFLFVGPFKPVRVLFHGMFNQMATALIMAVVSFALMGNTYTAQTSMYILANSNTESQSTNYTDLTASQLLANDVATLLQSDRVEADAASSLGLTDLSDYKVSVTSETTTRVISLVVTGPDPQGVADVANEMASQVSVVAQDVQMADSINVIDEAVAPTSPSGPNRMLYIAVAFLAGLFLAIAIVVLMDMLNTRIRSAEDAEELLGVPVVGRIPAMKKKGGK